MNVFKSPGLELNDMGYMRQADHMLNVIWTGYSFTEPFNIFRSVNLNNDVFVSSDFGGEVNGIGYEYNLNGYFKNFWNAGVGGGFDFKEVSTTMLRGGPSMLMPNSSRMYLNLGTDDRKVISADFFGSGHWGASDNCMRWSYDLELTARPFNTLSISLNPSYMDQYDILQYVSTEEMAGEDRYIFAHIDQKVLSMSLRVNYNIMPDLTIQYWGQPFIACGEYSGYKMITDPHAEVFQDRYREFTMDQMTLEDEEYFIDENRDGVSDYSFEVPDFTLDEWLSNLVIRWEFLPGSTAYLVWSQTRDYFDSSGAFEVMDNVDRLFTDKKASNTFLLKVSYRIGLR